MEILETLKTPGGKLRVRISNNNKPETLLMVHGFQDAKETFFRLEPFLAERFNLVSYDLRGHGDSSWNEAGGYFYQEAMIDLQLVVGKYLPEVFSAVGHSFGAALLTRYSGLFPWKVKSLVCLEGFSGRVEMSTERKRISAWLASYAENFSRNEDQPKVMSSLETAERIISSAYKGVPPDLHQVIAGYLSKKSGSGYIWKHDPKLKYTFPLPFPPELSRELWQNITAPVLIFFGSDSHLKSGNMDEILSHFRDVRFHEIKDAGHNLHLEKPEEIVPVLEKFYRKLTV